MTLIRITHAVTSYRIERLSLAQRNTHFNQISDTNPQRRRFESVYYHMRSISASNPIESARESLKVMLDENRKKYENAQRKQSEISGRNPTAAIVPSAAAAVDPFAGPLRRETWIHPEGGPRVYRTAPLNLPAAAAAAVAAADPHAKRLFDELCAMDHDELNRRFIVSFLHVHGKLITKIG